MTWVLITATMICPVYHWEDGSVDVYLDACPGLTQRACEGGMVDTGEDLLEVTSCFVGPDMAIAETDWYE